jgi:hypothetical protein
MPQPYGGELGVRSDGRYSLVLGRADSLDLAEIFKPR